MKIILGTRFTVDGCTYRDKEPIASNDYKPALGTLHSIQKYPDVSVSVERYK
jgi:hypothetical protein